jgi:xylulokinase/glycerol kinase
VNNGTGAFVFATTEEPVFDRERRTLCTPGAAAGTWNVEAGTLATGAVYQWFSRELEGSLQVREAEGADAGAENAGTLDALSRRAQASPVGANGVVLLPSFAGMAAPDWNPAARGVLMNLRLSTSLADVARAAIEGVALEIAGNVHLVRSVSGAEARVVAAGGLTQSTLFLRSLTDALDLPVSVSGIMEATTRGAMISAAVALDIHDSFATAIGRLIPEPARTLDPIPDNVAVLAQHRTYRAHLHGALSRERLYAGAQALGDQRR